MTNLLETAALRLEFGRIIAEECRTLNIRWAFGPVSDLNLNRENPITYTRCPGDDPDHSLSILKGIVKGMQDHGCSACLKHFPGDGTDSRNQHLVTSLNLLSREDWDLYHGRIFKELIEEGALSIMIGHMGFPAYEPVDEKKGIFRPATASKRLGCGRGGNLIQGPSLPRHGAGRQHMEQRGDSVKKSSSGNLPESGLRGGSQR